MSEVREVDEHSSSLFLAMNEKLRRYEDPALQGQVHSIHRVPPNIREGDPGAYEPHILSIGPYHHGKHKLRAMEEHKWRYLRRLLARSPQSDCTKALESCIDKIKQAEARARSCYSERVDLGSEKFVEMMVVDGCFILELFLLLHGGENKDDPISSVLWMVPVLWCDLLLLENQIPFFILEDLFSVAAAGPPVTDLSLKELALMFVMLPRRSEGLPLNLKGVEVCHLLHFYDLVLQPAIEETSIPVTATHAPSCSPAQSIIKKMNPFGPSSCIQLPTVLDKYCSRPADDDGGPRSTIPCVVELREAGIKLRRKPKANTYLDVTFRDGMLDIPCVPIDDFTNTTFRNLVAFEQCWPNAGNHFTTYVLFLDCIIDSSKDVVILQQAGIIDNELGSHKEVAQLINRLSKEVVYTYGPHYLANVFTEVNQYCESRCHKHLAMLRHTYFSKPWSIISFVAATSLLLMTLMQVIYAVLSYEKQ